MASLKLYHFILSTFSRKVRVAMAEKGIVCDKIVVDLMKGAQRNPDYLKLNPHGRVPTLLVGILSAAVGDNLGYWAGRAFGRRTVDRYALRLVGMLAVVARIGNYRERLADQGLHPERAGQAGEGRCTARAGGEDHSGKRGQGDQRRARQ